jgi:DNA-directed RNA polymerase specialized sigma24 family protein
MLEPEATQHSLVADADLLQRVVQRDSTALIELERRHRASLYAQAYGILTDSTMAEHVVREVFAQLWSAAERFIVRRSLWSWLRMLAKDLARAELMLRDTKYAEYSSERRNNEADGMAHPGPARTDVGNGAGADPDSELPRIRYRQGESGSGRSTPRDACAW